MALFAEFLTALNADVTAALAAGGYPPLVDGAILFGPARVFEHSRPPRIIVTPTDPTFSAPEVSSKSATLDTNERKQQAVMMAVHTERVMFEVRCWGGTVSASGIADYDLTRALYHAVLASLQRLVPNHGLDAKGAWTEAGPIGSLGQEFVITTWLDTPVLDRMLPYDRASQYAPAGVAPVTTDTYIAPTGETGSGC
jgi:hypothetical protein